MGGFVAINRPMLYELTKNESLILFAENGFIQNKRETASYSVSRL